MRKESPRFLVDFDHQAKIVEFGGAAQVVQVVQVVGSVFSHEFDIVVSTGVSHDFNHGGPDRVYMGGQGGLAGVQNPPELVRSHEMVYPFLDLSCRLLRCR